MTRHELIEAAKEIVSAMPGAVVHVPGYGNVQSTRDGTIIIDRGVVGPLDEQQRYDDECAVSRLGDMSDAANEAHIPLPKGGDIDE